MAYCSVSTSFPRWTKDLRSTTQTDKYVSDVFLFLAVFSVLSVGLWLSKVLFVQVAVIYLLQNQHFRQTGRQRAARRRPQGGKVQQSVHERNCWSCNPEE